MKEIIECTCSDEDSMYYKCSVETLWAGLAK